MSLVVRCESCMAIAFLLFFGLRCFIYYFPNFSPFKDLNYVPVIPLNRCIFISKCLLLFIGATFFQGCNTADKPVANRRVYIQKNNGKFTLFRNGKPYAIKGAGGYSHFRTLKECGGNTLRIWDTTGLQTVLDSANANGLAVVVGLPVTESENQAFYDNPLKVKQQYEAFRKIVEKHKSNPAVLMWCVGNELSFSNRPSKLPFYRAFNNITDMIHRTDPDHPITTAVLNFNTKFITNIHLRCDVDVISFNIFGRLPYLRQELESFSWLWDGPFMILEWGTNGPWEGTEQTEWLAYIEDTSWKKAEIYKRNYQKHMPVEHPRFLGSFVFFWGNKQEMTPTWFSLFDKNGAASEIVGTMEEFWKGKPPGMVYPRLEYMLLEKKGARENIILAPNATVNAEIKMLSGSLADQKITWQVFREQWYKKDQKNNERKPEPLGGLIKSVNGLETTLTTPSEEGPYRLFATVYNQNGTFASCNTPFYVMSDK